MTKTRKFALLLAILMLFSAVAVACADGKDDDDGEKKDWELPPEEEGRAGTPDDLPDDLDYDGYEFNIFCRAGDFTNFHENEGTNDPDMRNIIYTSVYERNLKVESRLNCDITWIQSANGGLSETRSEINSLILKSEWYDFINTTNNTIVLNGLAPYLCDLSMTEYINLDQPWWWMTPTEEISYDGYGIVYLIGEMNIINVLKMSAFYFNADLCNQYLQMVPKDFYDLVDNKQWTLEKLYTLCDTWIDIGTETGSVDKGDILSFPFNYGETMMQFIMSTRIIDSLYTRNPNGTVAFSMIGNEDIVTLIDDKLNKICHNARGTYETTGFDAEMVEDFASGRYLFFPQRLSAVVSDHFREMESDFGILPYPTLEEGDEYVSWIQDSSTSICIPGIVDLQEGALSRSSALIEALNAEAYRTTTEAFYETALKNRYTRDDDARRMIDIIYATARKSFMYEYNSLCGSMLGVLTSALQNGNSVVPGLESKNDAGQSSINEFILKTMQANQG